MIKGRWNGNKGKRINDFWGGVECGDILLGKQAPPLFHSVSLFLTTESRNKWPNVVTRKTPWTILADCPGTLLIVSDKATIFLWVSREGYLSAPIIEAVEPAIPPDGTNPILRRQKFS